MRKMKKISSKIIKQVLLIAVLMISALFTVTACGKSDEEVGTQLGELKYGEVPEFARRDEPLLGVYSCADDVIDICLGSSYYGEVENYAKVKVPTNYIIGWPDGGDEPFTVNSLESKEGFSELTFEAKVDGILEEIKFELISANETPYEEIKMQVGNYDIFTTELGEALYFVEEPEGMEETIEDIEMTDIESEEAEYEVETEDEVEDEVDVQDIESVSKINGKLNIYYRINEKVTLYILYQGPTLGEFSHDQLALNLCSIVEAIDVHQAETNEMN